MDDQLHDLQETISRKVHELVNEMTKDLSPEDELEVRQSLTETFRFWRRG